MLVRIATRRGGSLGPERSTESPRGEGVDQRTAGAVKGVKIPPSGEPPDLAPRLPAPHNLAGSRTQMMTNRFIAKIPDQTPIVCLR